MQRLEIGDAEIKHLAIQQEILRSRKSSRESRYDHRLHGLLLITAGLSTAQVAELFGEDRRTVQRWVRAFEENGIAGLREGLRAGRPKSFSARQMTSLGKDLRRRPWTFGYAAGAWDGKLVSEHLRRRYRVTLGVRQCQRLLHRLGSEFRVPRPQAAKG